jgi:cytochrome c oxidase cbb3-type subunit III
VKASYIKRAGGYSRWAAFALPARNTTVCFLTIWCIAGVASDVLVPRLRARQTKPPDKVAAHSRSAPIDGRKLFESSCATCHGLDGRGAERGPNIATRPAVRRLSDAEILTILRNGRPNSGMPAFGALGAAKLESLLGHLRSLQGLDRNNLASGDSKKGRELFTKKGACAECHTVNGVGGFLGPDLSIYGAVTPFVEMRDQIAHHDQSPRARTVTVATRDGRSLTGIVRNEDNFSLQLQTLDGNFNFLDKSALVSIDIKPIRNQAGEERLTLNANEVEALVSYLADVAKINDANGKLKRRPAHHEEED